MRAVVGMLAVGVSTTALGQAPSTVPPAPDCSAVSDSAPTRIDCDALARIDMVASEMVVSGHTPGLVVVITQGGRTVFARGYGQANIEAALPATPSTVF